MPVEVTFWRAERSVSVRGTREAERRVWRKRGEMPR